jgi:lipopolysaccharide exporter
MSRFSLKKRSEFVKNIIRLASGTAIAQVIGILSFTVLSRLFTEDEFGVFALVTSIYSYVTLIAGGRYEVALLIPKAKHEAANLLALSLVFNVICLLIFYMILFVLQWNGLVGDLAGWYYTLPLFVLAMGIGQSLSAWMNRQKAYKGIVRYRISQSVLNSLPSIGFGFLKTAANGMLLGYLISALASLIVLIVELKHDFRYMKEVVSWSEMKSLALRYYRFPVFNSLQALLDAAQINGLVYLVHFLFGSAVVGLLALAIRVLFAPMNFIGSSISQVFYQEATALEHDHKPIYPFLLRLLKNCALLILPVLLVLGFAGPQLFAFVFGENWRIAGEYAQYLAPWICLDFVRAPLSQVPLIFHKQSQLLVFTTVSNVVIVAILILGSIYLTDLKHILLLISISQVLYVLTLLFWILRITKKHDHFKTITTA